MKFHEFQNKLRNRTRPATPYQIQGNVARFYLSDWGEKYPKENLLEEMESLLDKRYDVYLYDSVGVLIMGTKANKKTPWRKKLGRSYGYFSSLKEAMEA